MLVFNTNTCCSLIELGEFDCLETPERIVATLKQFYEEEFIYQQTTELPYAMFAVTKDNQPEAEAALKALKFKPTKFKSRHAKQGEKRLTHWWRATPPTCMSKWLRDKKKEIQRQLNNEDW